MNARELECTSWTIILHNHFLKCPFATHHPEMQIQLNVKSWVQMKRNEKKKPINLLKFNDYVSVGLFYIIHMAWAIRTWMFEHWKFDEIFKLTIQLMGKLFQWRARIEINNNNEIGCDRVTYEKHKQSFKSVFV